MDEWLSKDEKRDISSMEQLERLAADLVNAFPQGAVLGLVGDLGAGKTTFVRAIAEKISEREQVKVPRITSPSFVIHQNYQIGSFFLEHYDLYRMDQLDTDGLSEIGYFEAFRTVKENPGFLFVEWPKKAIRFSDLKLEHVLEFRLQADGERWVVEIERSC